MLICNQNFDHPRPILNIQDHSHFKLTPTKYQHRAMCETDRYAGTTTKASTTTVLRNINIAIVITHARLKRTDREFSSGQSSQFPVSCLYHSRCVHISRPCDVDYVNHLWSAIWRFLQRTSIRIPGEITARMAISPENVCNCNKLNNHI